MNNVISKDEMVQIQERLHAFNNEFNILTKNVERVLLDGVIDSTAREGLKNRLKSYCNTYEDFINEIHKAYRIDIDTVDNMQEINRAFEIMKSEMNDLKLNMDVCLSETTFAKLKELLNKA